MPRRKWNLSRAEQAEYRGLAERLRASGGELNIDGFGANQDTIKVTQAPEPSASYVRLSPGRALFVMQLSIVALAPKLIIQDFELSCSEWDLSAYILGDPAVNRSSAQLYRLPDHSTFHRNEVLNHRVGPEGVLHRGDQIEGLLLADALQPTPERYKPGDVMEIVLSISDQFGDEHSAAIDLCVERWKSSCPVRSGRRSHLCEPAAQGVDSSAPTSTSQQMSTFSSPAGGQAAIRLDEDCPPDTLRSAE